MTETPIDPKRILYFATIVEQGSFNRATRLLGVSQPALSMAMDRLEAQLGVRLLDRGPSGVQPTQQGEQFFQHARKIREEIDLAKRHTVEIDKHPAAPIRFGYLPSLAGSVIAPAIEAWRARQPTNRLQVFERVQIDLLEGLLRRDFDFAIGVTDYYNLVAGLRQRVLFRDRLFVIARTGHPLLARPHLTLADIVTFPWVTPPAGAHNTLLEDVLASAGLVVPDECIICSSSALLKALVSGGDHLALLPAHAIRAEILGGHLTLLPLAIPELNRNIAVLFREGYQMDTPRLQLVSAIQAVGQEARAASKPQGSEPFGGAVPSKA